METLAQDVRHGVRQLVRSPGFTAVALVSLSLGIGANTAIFSLIHAVLIRPLPVKDPGELVVLTQITGPGSWYSFSYPLYAALRDQNHVLSGLLASSGDTRVELRAQANGASFDAIVKTR